MQQSQVSVERVAALVSLLTDETPKVREAAQAALVTSVLAGEWTAERLRAVAEAIEDPTLRSRARAGLEAVRVGRLEAELRALVAGEKTDLEHGAFLLARFEYPDLDVAACGRELDAMAQALAPEVARCSPREAARRLRDFIHDVRGFKGNLEAYDDPENVFLNRVLERRVGIPTSLAVVYLLLARRLNLALEGVNLPLHFLVRCRDDEGETFIDPFSRGRFLTRSDCRDFLRGAGLEAKPEFLNGATDRQVLSRLVRCLVSSFRSRGVASSASRYERCLAIVDRT
jgi:regulator of sirC expression with transglutaminase-like and TPR domain